MNYARISAMSLLIAALAIGCQGSDKSAEINLFAWSEYVPQADGMKSRDRLVTTIT